MPASSVLAVHVTPRASRDAIEGWRDGALRVRLRAPPVEGQANEALRRYLARRLDVPPAAIEVIAGARSRNKRLRISGLDESDLRARLGEPMV